MKYVWSRVLLAFACCSMIVIVLSGAEQEWKGQISENLCQKSHRAIADMVGYTDSECTFECVKAGGKYVLITSDGTMLGITNQDFAGLSKYAFEPAKITGERAGDTIVVSKIEPVGN